MKQGTLFYDKKSDRYNFHYTDEDSDSRDYGGIHCGEVFEPAGGRAGPCGATLRSRSGGVGPCRPWSGPPG